MEINLIKSGFLGKLGDLVFEPKGMAFQKFDRESSFNWADVKIIGAHPIRHFLGPNGDKISIAGTFPPHRRGKLSQMSDLRRMGAAGIPYRLIAADSESGQNLGLWIIRLVRDARTIFTSDGLPLKVDFTVDLESYAQDI